MCRCWIQRARGGSPVFFFGLEKCGKDPLSADGCLILSSIPSTASVGSASEGVKVVYIKKSRCEELRPPFALKPSRHAPYKLCAIFRRV